VSKTQIEDTIRLHFGTEGKKVSCLDEVGPYIYEALVEKKNGEIEMWVCDTLKGTWTKIE
jgi:hypothetical protein